MGLPNMIYKMHISNAFSNTSIRRETNSRTFWGLLGLFSD